MDAKTITVIIFIVKNQNYIYFSGKFIIDILTDISCIDPIVFFKQIYW